MQSRSHAHDTVTLCASPVNDSKRYQKDNNPAYAAQSLPVKLVFTGLAAPPLMHTLSRTVRRSDKAIPPYPKGIQTHAD
jgi:hypothetical protein